MEWQIDKYVSRVVGQASVVKGSTGKWRAIVLFNNHTEYIGEFTSAELGRQACEEWWQAHVVMS